MNEDDECQWLVTVCPDYGHPKRIVWLIWALTEEQANERALAKISESGKIIQTLCLVDLPNDEQIATYEADRNAR